MERNKSEIKCSPCKPFTFWYSIPILENWCPAGFSSSFIVHYPVHTKCVWFTTRETGNKPAGHLCSRIRMNGHLEILGFHWRAWWEQIMYIKSIYCFCTCYSFPDLWFLNLTIIQRIQSPTVCLLGCQVNAINLLVGLKISCTLIPGNHCHRA